MDALVPGPGDLALGPAWLMGAAEAAGVPLVAANLSCTGAPALPGARVVERDGLRLGIVGVLDPDAPVHPSCSVAPPGPAAAAALEALGPVDLVVALSRLDPPKEPAFMTLVPAVEVLVSGGSSSARSEPQLLRGGAVHLEAGTRGKRVGVATITLTPGAHGFGAAGRLEALRDKAEREKQRAATAREQLAKADTEARRARARRRVEYFEQQLPKTAAELAALEAELADAGPAHRIQYAAVGLGESVADHAPTKALLDVAKADIERIALETRAPDQSLKGPFVGSQVCRACHPDAFVQWSATPHASAWTTLVDAKRQMDQDCYACHSTGAHHAEGPQSPAQVGQLAGVGCESCHGPGRDHIGDPTHVDMVAAPAEAVCVQCHDGEQDEGRFSFDSYLPRVRHTP